MYSNIVRSWNGKAIRQREDGYLSATDMCQACGKQIKHWNENKSTHEYLEALSTDVGIPTTELIITIQGGIPQNQGTWVHDLVATELARWLSPSFSVQCNKWVRELLLTGYVTLNKDVQIEKKLSINIPEKPTDWTRRYQPIFWEN